MLLVSGNELGAPGRSASLRLIHSSDPDSDLAGWIHELSAAGDVLFTGELEKL